MEPWKRSSLARTRCRVSRKRQQKISRRRSRNATCRYSRVSAGLVRGEPRSSASSRWRRNSSRAACNCLAQLRAAPGTSARSRRLAFNSPRSPPNRCNNRSPTIRRSALSVARPRKSASNSASVHRRTGIIRRPSSSGSGSAAAGSLGRLARCMRFMLTGPHGTRQRKTGSERVGRKCR